MRIIQSWFEFGEYVKDRPDSQLQRFDSLTSIWCLCFGMFGNMIEGEGRVSQKKEVGLGEVAVANIGIALLWDH